MLFCFSQAGAQEELGRVSEQSSGWTMIGFDRTWVPQERGFPNGGFGFTTFTSLNQPRSVWLGLGFRATGVHKRDALALTFGPGFQLLGTSRLGMFAYVQAGMSISSNNALTGFDFFTDTSTSFGLTSIGAVGGSVEIFSNVKFYTAVIGTYFSNERGYTPFGLQAGMTIGGK